MNEKKGEASTPEFCQGAISVLLRTLSQSIDCTPALHLLVFPVKDAVVRASSILEDFNCAATLVLCVHKIENCGHGFESSTI